MRLLAYALPLLLLWVTSAFEFKNKDVSEFTIEISNLRGEGADIRVGFFGENSSFPNSGRDLFSKVITVPKGQTSISMTWEIPNGNYAIAVFEDTNGNDELDNNFLGIPTEPYGFSKNYVPKLSAPDYEDCAIEVKSDITVKIELID